MNAWRWRSVPIAPSRTRIRSRSSPGGAARRLSRVNGVAVAVGAGIGWPSVAATAADPSRTATPSPARPPAGPRPARPMPDVAPLVRGRGCHPGEGAAGLSGSLAGSQRPEPPTPPAVGAVDSSAPVVPAPSGREDPVLRSLTPAPSGRHSAPGSPTTARREPVRVPRRLRRLGRRPLRGLRRHAAVVGRRDLLPELAQLHPDRRLGPRARQLQRVRHRLATPRTWRRSSAAPASRPSPAAGRRRSRRPAVRPRRPRLPPAPRGLPGHHVGREHRLLGPRERLHVGARRRIAPCRPRGPATAATGGT